jgi:hypothetical protein
VEQHLLVVEEVFQAVVLAVEQGKKALYYL